MAIPDDRCSPRQNTVNTATVTWCHIDDMMTRNTDFSLVTYSNGSRGRGADTYGVGYTQFLNPNLLHLACFGSSNLTNSRDPRANGLQAFASSGCSPPLL